MAEKSRRYVGARLMGMMILTFLICASDGTQCELGYQAHRSCVTAQAYVRAGLHPALIIKDIVCSEGKK
jgi:hypothetical protein